MEGPMENVDYDGEVCYDNGQEYVLCFNKTESTKKQLYSNNLTVLIIIFILLINISILMCIQVKSIIHKLKNKKRNRNVTSNTIQKSENEPILTSFKSTDIKPIKFVTDCDSIYENMNEKTDEECLQIRIDGKIPSLPQTIPIPPQPPIWKNKPYESPYNSPRKLIPDHVKRKSTTDIDSFLDNQDQRPSTSEVTSIYEENINKKSHNTLEVTSI